MKKVLIAIILPVIIFSLSHLAAGQASSKSLDAQLFEAVESGDTAAVQQLLQEGANIEARDNEGFTHILGAVR